MRWNPVFWKEITVDSRSVRLPVVIFIFNLILSAAAIFNIYNLNMHARLTAEIQYSAILELYSLISTLEFVMLLLLMPALTAPAICGEREKDTLDVLVSTSIHPRSIVTGKLGSAPTEMLVLLLSALPVQSLVFIFGGVTMPDIILVFITYVAAVMYIGGIGIFCSALFRKNVMSNAASYMATAILTAGTFADCRFYGLLRFGQGVFEMYGGTAAGAGKLMYLLLFNPAVTFACVINLQAGSGDTLEKLASRAGPVPRNMITANWIPVSLVLQIAAAFLLIGGAIWLITPGRGRQDRRKLQEES